MLYLDAKKKKKKKKPQENKKVLLRERKRHTARCVAALSPDLPMGRGVSPSRREGGYPIQSCDLGGVPHPVSMGRGTPPCQDWKGVPLPIETRDGGNHPLLIWDRGNPSILTWDRVPPPPHPDLGREYPSISWMGHPPPTPKCKKTPVKTVPSLVLRKLI